MASVFAIYDKKAECFLSPWTMQAVGQAVRAFSDGVNDPKSQFHRHVADFDLYMLGEFNDVSGEFKNSKEFIVGAVSLMSIPAGFKDDSQLGIPFEGDENGSE